MRVNCKSSHTAIKPIHRVMFILCGAKHIEELLYLNFTAAQAGSQACGLYVEDQQIVQSNFNILGLHIKYPHLQYFHFN